MESINHSNKTCRFKSRLLIRLDWLTLHTQSSHSLEKNYNQILECNKIKNTQHRINLTQDRLDVIKDRKSALKYFSGLKITAILAWMVIFTSMLVYKLNETIPEISYIYMKIAFYTLTVVILPTPLLFFNRSRSERILNEHEDYLQLELSSISRTEDENNKESNKCSQERISIESSHILTALYRLMKYRAKSNVKIELFKKSFHNLFVSKDGKLYEENNYKNIYTPKKETNEGWKILDNYINKLSTYSSSGINPQYEFSHTSNDFSNDILDRINKNEITFNLPKEEIKILLKTFCHHVIEGHDDCGKLDVGELFFLKKLFSKIEIKSKDEIKERPRTKSRTI